MKLKVKDMDIATGGSLTGILNKKDAEKLDLHALDRIKIKKKRKIETIILSIAESKKAVPVGKIGLYEEALNSLKLKDKDVVEIIPAKKPWSLESIKKKLDGKTLSNKEISQIVWDIVHNKLSDVELTYFVAACYTKTMTLRETIQLTKAMASHGDTLKINKYPVIDKHCVGGVPGNRTTMIVVPIIAAADLTMPKTSSRSITSPAGTADTMEVLANVSIPIQKMKRIVEKANGCIVWGGALNLAPADDKIIKVERPLGIDAESQLLASIIAKKHSVSSTHILIDIPYGSSKIKNKKDAIILKKEFIKIGKNLKKHIEVTLTDGSQPIGNGIGPALEARDVLWVLMGDYRMPKDLKNKSVMMAGKLLEMSGKAKIGYGIRKSMEILESDKAYKKMIEIIKAQGKKITNPEEITLGKIKLDVKSNKKGVVSAISNDIISKIARIAGAPQDKGAGVYLRKHKGDYVKKGERLFTVYSESKDKVEYVKEILKEGKGFSVR